MPSPSIPKKWTVMVYLAGDNNLDSAGVTDLNEMKQVGSNDNVNIIAQFDRASLSSSTNRYYLRNGTTLVSDIITSLGETNMGDPSVLQGFLEWGIDNYPADHYLVVMWNHGNGWDDEDIYRSARTIGLGVTRRSAVLQEADSKTKRYVSSDQMRAVSDRFGWSMFAPTVHAAIRTRGIAYDDQAMDFLDNQEVKKVFNAIKTKLGRKIDILGMDACLMNMVEVAYEVRDSISFIVGSEETEPGAGWPYNTILERLSANPDMLPAGVSGLIVIKYLASYSASAGVTQSALDQAKVIDVRQAVEKLGALLRIGLKNRTTRLAIFDARRRVQRYHRTDYVDLVDLCVQLKVGRIPAAARSICDAVINSVRAYVVKNGYKGSSVDGSNGVSIYFPTNGVSRLYSTLDFAMRSQWAKFIAEFQV